MRTAMRCQISWYFTDVLSAQRQCCIRLALRRTTVATNKSINTNAGHGITGTGIGEATGGFNAKSVPASALLLAGTTSLDVVATVDVTSILAPSVAGAV